MKRINKNLAVLLWLLLFLGSCFLVDLRDIEYETYPAERNEVVESGQSPWIEFSLPPIRHQAEALLKITGPGGNVEGYPVWEGKRLLFLPYTELTPGTNYLLTFEGSFSVEDGRSYDLDLKIPFYYLTDTPPPLLTTFSPSCGASVDVREEMILAFSNPMDSDIFEREFSLSPSAECSFTWNPEKTTVTIAPLTRWTNLIQYQWKISTALRDQEGIPTIQEYASHFLTQQDTAPPRLTRTAPARIQPDGSFEAVPLLGLSDLDNNDEIMLLFDEAVDFTSLNSAFSLNPDLGGHLKQVTSESFVYVKGENYTPGQEYILTLDTSLADTSGNMIAESLEERFTPAISKLQVTSLALGHNAGPDILVLPDEDPLTFNYNQNTPVSHSDIAYLGAPGSYLLKLTIHLNQSFSVDRPLERQMMAETVHCETVFPKDKSAPSRMNTSWVGDTTLEVHFQGFEQGTADDPIYYRFFLSGGNKAITSDSGGWPEEDVYFYIEAP